MHGERKHETEEWYECMYAVIGDEKEKGEEEHTFA